MKGLSVSTKLKVIICVTGLLGSLLLAALVLSQSGFVTIVLAVLSLEFFVLAVLCLTDTINKMATNLESSKIEKIQAENASQNKSFFLASVSHEIRTPLSVIIGLAESLIDPTSPPEERLEYAKTIEKTGKNLNRIVNDILDMSKVEAGFIEVEKSTFSIRDFIGEIENMLQVRAHSSNNRLTFLPKGEVPQKITTDRTRLRQILVNLIGNSLKYTRSGIVAIKYWVDLNQIVFEVKDNGVGISEEHQSQIFQPFSKTPQNPKIESRSESTGLGLVLCRRLAQALNGDVTLIQSAPNCGSTFQARITFEIGALENTPEASTSNMELESLKGKKVLVVDDVPENQWVLQLHLRRKGMLVDFAQNGLQAVEKTLSGDYDVVLMDMQMPVMDGFTAVKALRENDYRKPVIALTAHAMKDDRARCIAAGCDGYLSKPIETQSLYRLLAFHLRQINSVA